MNSRREKANTKYQLYYQAFKSCTFILYQNNTVVMTRKRYILVKITVVGWNSDNRWNSTAGLSNILWNKQGFCLSIDLPHIPPKKSSYTFPLFELSWQISDDLHQQMQQVDYKEGFMKGSVQLCSIDETPAHARHDRFIINSKPAERMTFVGILSEKALPNLVHICWFLIVPSYQQNHFHMK